MDSHADLVRRDDLLPGLRVLLEPARLARALERASDVAVSAIEPVYIRYKARTSCLVAYRVRGTMGDAFVYAKAFRPSAGGKVGKALASGGVATWLGPGPLVLPHHGIVAWAHPNDARLPLLCRTTSVEGRAVLLRRAPPALSDTAALVLSALSYRPERRFVAELRRRGAGAPAAVIKMYTGAGYGEALARTRCVRSCDLLRVPRRLARDSRRHLLFLEWLPGQVAGDVLHSAAQPGPKAALVGEALAELHRQPIAPSMPRSSSYDAATVANVLDDVAFVFPPLARTLARLRASVTVVPVSASDVTPVHGDLHLRQILLPEGGVGIVDFDRAGAGPASGDVACCLAHLERDVLAGVLDRTRADEVADGLLAGYARGRPRPPSHVLRAHMAAALARLLPDPFRHCRPDAFDHTAAMADRAQALLARAETRVAAS